MKRQKIFISSFFALVFLLALSPAMAQDKKMSGSEFDMKKDKMETMYVLAYDIMDRHPGLSYDYVYKDGKVTEVRLVGVDDPKDREMLTKYLANLENLRNEIKNVKDDEGIYYVTETNPKPADGYEEMYEDIRADLQYPEVAEDYGVQGTVFVKFVVKSDGDVRNIKTMDNIDTPFTIAEKELIKEAERTIRATSDEWIPAKVGGVAVDHWVSIPVKFNLEGSHYTRFNM